jgi:hypothetical protein
MATEYTHRIYCDTDQRWETVIKHDDEALIECPTNSAHNIRDESAHIQHGCCIDGYKIQDDVEGHILDKDFLHINYKSELISGVSYTPVFIIHSSGINSGLLEKTDICN